MTLARAAPMTLAAAAFAALAACASAPDVVTRKVTLHAPAACAPGAAPYALFYPLGDFQPPAPASLPLASVGVELGGFPASTRELVVTTTDANEAAYLAHGLVPASGDADLLLLPRDVPCSLSGSVGARTGAAIVAVDATHLLVAGGTGASGAVPVTALADLARGSVAALRAGLLVPRSGATATAWSGGAILAGGVRPDTGETLASAELFTSAAGDFDGAPIALSEGRARHAAVTLASGETLLVGGVDAAGDALGSMEVVDPVAGRARTAGLVAVEKRAGLVALRLASGEILLAGGLSASGEPVSTLEWLAPDGSAFTKKTQSLAASAHSAFVALASGGALAVVAPGAPSPGFQNVWVITADGALEAATPIDGALEDVRFFDGAGQAPLLWTGDRWLVWQPWLGAFTALADAEGSAGPAPGSAAASVEPGLGSWLDGDGLRLLRFGARGPYASTPASSPLLAIDTAFTAPDRLVVPGETGPIAFDPATGLLLDPGASVFLTDATFASFALDVATPELTGDQRPAIVLRDATGDETVLDGATCPLPAGAALHVERRGASVDASVDGQALVSCTVTLDANARVSIGVRGASAPGVVRELVVTRL